MKKPEKQSLEQARAKLKKMLPFEKIKQIPKYRNFNKAQYLQLLERLEVLSVLLLESYIFTQNSAS